MAIQINDRVLEVTTSVGTSSIELNNVTPSGFVTFSSGVGNGSGTYYAIVHQTQPEWEIGYGILASGHPLYPATGAAPTLTRTTVLSSSNGSVGSYSKVSFSAGSKTVYNTAPAARMVLLDNNGNLQVGDTNYDTTYRAIFEGDVRASGINAGSGLLIEQSLAPSSGNTINRLYNTEGTLYWGDTIVATSTSDGAGSLFNISAPPSGIGHIGIQPGSGIVFQGGENVVTSLSDGGNGSGIVTISVPTPVGTDFTLTASGVGEDIQITTGSGLGIVPANDTIKVELIEDRGSGIFKLSTNPYTAGTGLVLQTPSGYTTPLQFNALPATIEQSGIVLLTNTIDSNSGSGTAATPYAVQSILATGVIQTLDFGATAGIAPVQLTNGSGMLFVGGDNVTATLSDEGNGSGVVTISSTSYTAGSGLRLMPDTGAGAEFNLDVESLSNLGAGDAGPDNADKIIVYDESAQAVRNVSVSGLAANSSFAGGYKFTTINGGDSDTGYSWGSTDITAGAGSDTLKFVGGEGISVNTDSTNKAVKITASGLALGADSVSGTTGAEPIDLTLGSGIIITGGSNITTALTKSNGSGVLTINTSVGGMTSFNFGLLGNTVNVTNGSGIQLVAGENISLEMGEQGLNNGSGVITISTTGVASRLIVGGQDGRENMQLGDGSGLFFAAGDNISVTLSNADGGSGVVTIATTGVGTRLMLEASDGREAIQLGDGSGIRVAGGAGILSTLSNGDGGSGIITIAHEDTSSQASVNNSGQVFIQDITLDTFGHITSITSATATGSAAGGGQAASGADGQMQYNNGGFMAGASGLYYDDTNNRVGVGTSSPLTGLHIAGTGIASKNIDDSSNPQSRPPVPVALGLNNPVVMIQQTVDANGNTIQDGGNGGFICPGNNGLIISTMHQDDSISITASGSSTPFLACKGDSERVGILTQTPKSTLHVGGSLGLAVSGATEPATLTDKHSVVLVDLTDRAASGTINLPLAGSETIGRTYTIKKVDSTPSGVNIIPDSGQLIDGKSQETLFCKNDVISIIAATGLGGSYGWNIISRDYKPHVTAIQASPQSMSRRAGDFGPFYSWYKTWTDIPFDFVVGQSASGSAEFNKIVEPFRQRDFLGAVKDADGDGVADVIANRFYPSGVGSGVRVLRDGLYQVSARASFGFNFNNGDDRAYVRVLHHRLQGVNDEGEVSASGLMFKHNEFARGFSAGRDGHAITCSVEGVCEAKAGDFITAQVWHSHGSKRSQPAYMQTREYVRNQLVVEELFID